MAEKTEQHWVRNLEAKKEEIKGVIEMSSEKFLPLRQYKQRVCGALKHWRIAFKNSAATSLSGVSVLITLDNPQGTLSAVLRTIS